MDEIIQLSILIPAYNSEICLANCLDSIYSDFTDGVEVIVVNDGSTDGTQSVINHYVNYKNFKTITTNNRGRGPARNSAISLATGK